MEKKLYLKELKGKLIKGEINLWEVEEVLALVERLAKYNDWDIE